MLFCCAASTKLNADHQLCPKRCMRAGEPQWANGFSRPAASHPYKHQQRFTCAVQRLGDQALLGRTRRCTGEVPCNDSALHRQVETHRPRARKSLSALGCKCMIRMRRAARSHQSWGGRGGESCGEYWLWLSTLQLQHPQIRTQTKLQRRPPLQIHRKIGLLSRGVRMYCSHLLSAASVFNCRWLYYTQEDAKGMYE
jgi:hypothetical protein